jgi:integrase
MRGLNAHFGELQLQDITIHAILSYRSKRQSSAGAGLINHEINALAQILTLAGQWKRIAPYYKQMKVKSTGPGRAITRDEAMHLFKVVSSRTKWKVAYLGSLVAANTACGPGELSRVKLSDIDLAEGVLRIVEGTKNNRRQRSIPLNEDAQWAIGELLKLAREKGACQPEHYLIPRRAFRCKGQLPDPTRHITSWQKAWHLLRDEAAKHCPGLANLRRYDLRHTAATMLAENPNVSEGVLKDILGHGPYSQLAQDHYSHVRMGPKRGAIDSLAGLRPDWPKPMPQQIIARRLSSAQEDPLDILQQAQMGKSRADH